MTEGRSRVIEIFRSALDLPEEIDIEQLRYLGHPNWTSLGHMNLVAALEESFDIMLDADDILAMSSLDRALEILRKHHAVA